MAHPEVAVITLAVIALVNITYYLFFLKLGKVKNNDVASGFSLPISIIVYSKNESQRLKKLVPLLLDQDYSDFEIVLINHASMDDTLAVIDELHTTDGRVKKVDVENNENFWAHKKYALTLGIKKASYSHLLFLNADSEPISKEWISHIANNFKNHQIVLGYGAFKKEKNSLLNALIRYETSLTAIQYLSYTAHGNPYTGVSRNLAYTKDLFYEVSGFMGHMNVPGGAHDLLVNQAAVKANTTISIHPDSFTISEPEQSWKSWWLYKKNEIHTVKYFKRKHKLLLSLYFLSQLGFIVCAIVAFVFANWVYTFSIVLFRYLVMWIAVGKGLSRFRESDIIIITPILEIISVITRVFLFLNTMINPPKRMG